MTIHIKNTSRYDHDAVSWLVRYAARFVRSEAKSEGWLDDYERCPSQIQIKNCARSFSGCYLGQARLDGRAMRRLLIRIGSPTFPVDATYARYRNMPKHHLNNWEETVVYLTAHELTHIKYNYANGDRKGAELCCEDVGIACITQFRKDGWIKFADAMIVLGKRLENRRLANAAKQSPEAVAAKKMSDAEEKLTKWQRKHALATTKVKHYRRLLGRLRNRSPGGKTNGL